MSLENLAIICLSCLCSTVVKKILYSQRTFSKQFLCFHFGILMYRQCDFKVMLMCSSARQDAMETKRLKLDYEEITPCLKEVTKVWDEMLKTPSRALQGLPEHTVLDALKAGQ